MDFSDHAKKYLESSYRYLAVRNRSEKEMRDYLTKKKCPPELIDQIIESLTRQKFLNDEEFARLWIRGRALLRPKGKRLLQFELKQKGIAQEIIQKVLSETQEELPDELTQAKAIIGKRIERLAGKPRQEIYAKVGAFLARRGFSWEIIKKAIDDTLANRV